ncbi:unnamed protein product [Ectocarpus sp. 6 AP-2014]
MSGASGGSTHAPTRCLYLALGVPRDASPPDIKKAYRKQALVWHPDKNVGNEAEAQVRFQELQHAYAVLSNAHERKWYDDHRDEILNPARYEGDGDSDDGAGGRTVNVTPFFSAATFSGFGDDESGFYQTYTRAFREVWDAERDWGEASSDGIGWGQGSSPEMGGSKDSYETAEEFYGTWSGFVSGLSFGWVDEYNVNEAENRRVRRLMEKENSKKRAIARRKYQDDVRALVDFCRRRDRRVIRYKLKLAKDKEERERRRHEEALNQKEDMKRRKHEWARAKHEEEEAEEEARARAGGEKAFRLDDEDDEDDDDEDKDDGTGSGPEEEGRHRKKNAKRRTGRGGKGSGGREQEVTVFVCAVCKKDFKSKGQMSNHETSKAHKKKLKELDAEMLREAMAKTAGRKWMEGEDHDNSSSASEDGSSDAEGVASSEGEGDFFMDSAMRDLDLDGSSHNQTATVDRKKEASLSASAGSDSDEEETKPGGSRSSGEAKMQPQNRGRGLFDFGSSSGSSSEENSSGSSSDSDSSGSGSSGSGSGSGSDSGSGDNDEDDPNLFETIATASEAASQIDPDGDMRTAAAVAASAAAMAAANAATDRFHLSGDLGSAVSAATSAGLSWWKKHNTEASDGEEDADVSMRARESDDSEAGTNGKNRKNSKGDHDHNHSPAKGKHHREHAAKRAHGHSKAGTHEGEQGRRRHTREEDQDDSEHWGKKGNPAKGQQTGHARGRGAHQRSPNETRSGSSSGARSDDGSDDSRRVEELEPAGKRGRRKCGGHHAKAGNLLGKNGKGGGADNAAPAGGRKGARRRKRQALKAAKGGHGKNVGHGTAADGGPRQGGEEGGLSCRVCGSNFPSRSKLFAHVKAEGHAVLS